MQDSSSKGQAQVTSANQLLIIDDERPICDLIADVAEAFGYRAFTATSYDEARAILENTFPTLIFVDLMLPDVDGIEIVRHIGAGNCDAKIVMMSGVNHKILASAIRVAVNQGLNVLGYLTKPFSVRDVRNLLETGRRQNVMPSVEELSAAIEAEELCLFYQPKVQLDPQQTMSVTGAEALLRWKHPEYGLITPDRILPVAEANDLMGPLTDFVIKTAIEQLRAWKNEGVDVVVSVNMPPNLLTDRNLPDRLAVMMAEAQLDPGQLCLEMTENVPISDYIDAAEILTRFRLKGFGLSLDDFGTGHSSLIQLHQMPFSELKIDRSFITEIDGNPDAQIIVRAIVDLAKNLELTVCAEGVETAGCLRYLRNIGCHQVQGFYFGRPTPGEAFAELVRRWYKGSERQEPSRTGDILC
jgi:EAL domain-containing protein (putative c-di-GMP-specific phosphodiesterase class I)